MPTERPREPAGGGVSSEALCQVLGGAEIATEFASAGSVRNFAGGSIASGAGRFVGSISMTSSSGDANRALDAARMEFERGFDIVSEGKDK